MKFSNHFRIPVLLGLTVLFVGLQSCSTDADEQEIPQEQQLSQAELQTIMNTDQWTGVADSTLAELFQNGNGASGKAAQNECYEAVYSDTGYTVTFGNCVLNGTENVNGTLVVTYATGEGTASFTATYEAFYVGNIEVNGTRTFTIQEGQEPNSVSFSVTSSMSVTLADESVITENGTKTVEITFGETLSDITFAISGEWTVEMDGNTYIVDVTSPLTGNLGCAYLVSGIMDLSKNGLGITVDLGDGQCDNKAMVIYPNGVQEEFILE